MSLQVWLPLNGNINNQGLSNVTVTNNGATVNDSGKIGKCYAFGEIGCLNLGTQVLSGKPYATICFWMYRTSDDYQAFMFGNGGGYWQLGLTNGMVRVRDNKNGISGNRFDKDVSIPINTWVHFALTYNQGNLKAFVNGELSQSWSTGGTALNAHTYSYIGYDSYNSGYKCRCNLNDVRIYDHCLSPKEVKEISKGTVLHYRLAGVGAHNMVNSLTAGERTTIVDNYSIDANFGANLDTYCYIKCSAMTLDTQYTLSFDVSGMPNGSAWSWKLWNRADYEFTVTKDGRYSYTFTPTASKLPSGYSLTKFLFDDGGRSNPSGTVRFSNFKLEEGSVATPWCPNPSDTLYTQLGFNDNIEYDCSGLRNNGTKVGAITWSGDTPRYSGSYKLSDSASCIQAVNLANLIHDGIFSMNIWFKKTTGEWSTKAWETIFGGPSGFELSSKSSVTNSPKLVAYSWGHGTTGGIVYTLDTWHMVTMVRNASNTLFYLDGTLMYTGSAGSIPSGTYFFGACSDTTHQNYRGYLSDARIYATALSADDIKELYKTSAIATNNGNLMAYELIEE